MRADPTSELATIRIFFQHTVLWNLLEGHIPKANARYRKLYESKLIIVPSRWLPLVWKHDGVQPLLYLYYSHINWGRWRTNPSYSFHQGLLPCNTMSNLNWGWLLEFQVGWVTIKVVWILVSQKYSTANLAFWLLIWRLPKFLRGNTDRMLYW